ncbi:ankyrin repeat domain-containing protein [Maribacter sp. MMG018]|uniref:ankyrin repeat domain-containing protein n=1 Tax=Maribacter sp. MMG018 TaxID=2822688 RepID=UPI001B39C5C6|nr:ankyrin repeat domain-containing protein [Maribacter sp. MMG018]MBQ4915029.1 ankyrin repeat domain-containing protein [Maribacter sp. MMG018]
MKTSKNNSLKQMSYVLLVMALCLTACGQQKQKTNDQAMANTEVSAPEIPLTQAVVTGNLEAVKQHIEAGTDLNEKDALSGATPLMSAITFDKSEIAAALIDAGADLEVKNNDGSTALHVAAFFGRVELVQLLIDAKADKTVKNNYGATARESVSGPFEDMKPIYEMMQQQLGPIGLDLNLAEVEKARPVIAIMLQ